MPPRKLVEEVGSGDYAAVGEEFFRYFVDVAGLQPHESVLDVGCGCGRMAVPLTRHLGQGAWYEGFDIQPRAIKWCRKNITARFPSFGFKLADVYSERYNPKGRYRAGEYRFPYADATFDFILLTSVFTHMLRGDMEHYLDEITRVAKPGGRCLVTYFLLNEESRRLMDAGRSSLTFPHEVERTAVMKKNVPESAVAFPVDIVRRAFETHGLVIDEPIRFGRWCGRETGLSFQDVIVARRAFRSDS